MWGEICAYVNAGTCRVQKRAMDSLKLELITGVYKLPKWWCEKPNSHPLPRAGSALNC